VGGVLLCHQLIEQYYYCTIEGYSYQYTTSAMRTIIILLLAASFCSAQSPLLNCQGDQWNSLSAYQIYKPYGDFLSICGDPCQNVIIQTYPAEGECLKRSWYLDDNLVEPQILGDFTYCLPVKAAGVHSLRHELTYGTEGEDISNISECSFEISRCCGQSLEFSWKIIDQSENLIRVQIQIKDDYKQNMGSVQVSDANGTVYKGNEMPETIETSFGRLQDRICVEVTTRDGCNLSKCIRLDRLTNTLESSRFDAKANVKQAPEAKIWPNPAGDVIYFDLSEYRNLPLRIRIVNSLGTTTEEIILSDKQTGDVYQHDLSSYQNGYYWVEMECPEYSAAVHEMVVARTF
jgi:Secretion system C-terminal sorting domain